MLVLDSAQKITITGDARDLGNTYKVEGSPDTKLYLEYNELATGQKIRTDSLESVFNNALIVQKLDSLSADSLSKELQIPYEKMIASYSDIIAKKIKENPSSLASIMAIQQIKPEIYLDVYKALDKGLTEKYPNNEDIKSFHGMVQQTEMMVSRTQAIKVGAEAPELILPMPNDKDLPLSALRGKVVLIDFWASWCGPCRKELPNVKRCYEKYKSKGFEILGVSLDKNRDEWIEAISKEGLTWPQVSDLKFWQSEAVQIYAVQSIPYTVLIDKNGIIIATDLRGAELDKKLAEVLK
jgi:peroxiredoxin